MHTLITRHVLSNGRIQLSSQQCVFLLERLRSDAMFVHISGTDYGQFDTSVLDEIRLELMRNSPIELFIDAQNAISATLEVSQEWTRFFRQHQVQLKRVHILVGSKFIELVVSIAQHLSRTGDLIHVYEDPVKFNQLIGQRLPSGK